MTEQFRDFRAEITPQDDVILHQEESFPTATFVDSGGLGDFHVNNDVVEESNGRAKLFAGIAVAVVVGIAGAYGVSQYMKDRPAVADSNLPKPTAPSKTAAMTPPPAPAPAAAVTAPTAPQTAPSAPDMVKPAPVTRQAAATPRMMPVPRSSSTTMTPAPVPAPQAAIEGEATNVPAPSTPDAVTPTPPAASLAANPALNEQSAPAEQAAPVDQAPAQAPAPAPDVMTTPAPATPDATQAQ